jgi:uncharacterized protein (UPF0147 family)
MVLELATTINRGLRKASEKENDKLLEIKKSSLRLTYTISSLYELGDDAVYFYLF